MRIRPRQPTEAHVLLALWERSVRATHMFLAEADVETDVPIGFLALSGKTIDALFLEPAHRGTGHGRRLVEFAQALRGGALTVDVNEENVAALGFYEALGFDVFARSALDGTGRRHPILHMLRPAPDEAAEPCSSARHQ